MAEERHYQAVVRLGTLHTDAEARLKAALIERAANEIGAGPVLVVALDVAETTWSSLLGCDVCGSVVCQGPSSHAERTDTEDEPKTEPWVQDAATRRILGTDL